MINKLTSAPKQGVVELGAIYLIWFAIPIIGVACPPAQRGTAHRGYPTERALAEDSPLLFLDHMHTTDIPDRVTSLFVRRCVYLAFFGPLPATPGESSPSDATGYTCDGDSSPLYVPEDNGMDTTLEEGQVVGHSQIEDNSQSGMELGRF